MNPIVQKNVREKRDPVSIFKNALEGCYFAFTSQKNFLFHFTISILVVILALWLELPLEKLVLLTFAITLGLVVEMVNTTLESTIDLITQEWRLEAKRAKDVAAGTMLIASFGLAIIGLLILLPPLWQKLF